MARYAHIRNNFLLGEVSPTFNGRTDVQNYPQACEKLLNHIIRPSGGAFRRRGTRLITESLDDAHLQTKSTVQSVKQIRFQKWQIIITSTAIKYYDVNDSTLSYTIASVAAYSGSAGTYGTDCSLSPGSLQYAAYGNVLVITDGYSNPLIVVNDSGTLKYVVWGFGEIKVDAAGTFSLDTDEQHRMYPYDTENTDAGITITVTGGGSVTAVGSTVTLTASSALFKNTMAKSGYQCGLHVRLRYNVSAGVDEVGVVEITGYTSTTVVTGIIRRAISASWAGSAKTRWAFSQWNIHFGFPMSFAFFQERLWGVGTYASATNKLDFQDYAWATQLGDLYEFSRANPSTTLAVDDAYQVATSPNASAAAVWVAPMNGRLFVGLENQVTYFKETDSDIALGAGNTTVKQAHEVGCIASQPVVIENAIVYLDITGRLREIVYNQQEDVFKATDLNEVTEDLSINRAILDYGSSGSGYERAGFFSLAYSADLKTIFALDAFGSLFSCTRSRDQGVLAWAHHRLGGNLAGAEVRIIDISLNQSRVQFSQEHLVLTTRRTIGGVAYTAIEVMECVPHVRTQELYDTGYTNDNPANMPIFMDCTIVHPISAGQGPGLDQFELNGHFIAQEVSVIADGNYMGEVTLENSGGGDALIPVTISSDDYTLVFVGFTFDADIVPLALNSNALFGEGLGQIKRTEHVTVLFNKSVTGSIGVSTRPTDLQPFPFREASVASGDPTPLYTGEKGLNLMCSYETKQNILLRSSDPLPCEVSAIICKGLLYD